MPNDTSTDTALDLRTATKLSLLALFVAAIFAVVASAFFAPDAAAIQSCPEGQVWSARPYQVTGPNGQPQMQQNFGCYPVNGPSKSVKWIDRWGAVAGDGKSIYGIVKDMPSKSEAEREAIADCASRGGINCQLHTSYYNHCIAVIAWPTGSYISRAAYEKEAISMGIKYCKKENKGACRIYHSECSLPVRAS